MVYLYGDSTQFPLGDNFLDLLRELIDLGTQLLRTAEALEDTSNRRQGSKREIDQEAAYLSHLAGSISRVLADEEGPMGTSASAPIAAQVRSAVRAVFDAAENDLQGRRERMLEELDRAHAEQRVRIERAVETFLLHHELPDTTWKLSWRAGSPRTSASAHMTTPFGLEATLELGVAGTAWAKAIRLSELDKGLDILLPVARSWLRRNVKERRFALGGYFLTKIDQSSERTAIVVRKSGSRPSAGMEIVVRADGQARPTVRRLSKSDTWIGKAIELHPLDGAVIQRLWGKIEAKAVTLRASRKHLIEASFGGQPLAQIARPVELVEKLVACVTPIVREILHRSQAGELVLKRDLGNGRREEIYMKQRELAERLAELSPAHRALFTAFGLGEEEGSGLLRLELKDFDDGERTIPVAPRTVESADPTMPDAHGLSRKLAEAKGPLPAIPHGREPGSGGKHTTKRPPPSPAKLPDKEGAANGNDTSKGVRSGLLVVGKNGHGPVAKA